MSVLSKLMQARLLLQAAPLKKSGHNKFAGYYYFELGDFLPTVQQIFSDLGLCGLVSYTADIATLTITDLETDKGVSITSPMGSAALKGCHEVQNIGAVETYQRRYLWVTAMEIVEHDALDSVTGSPDAALKAEPKAAKPALANEPQKPQRTAVAQMASDWDTLTPEQQKEFGGCVDSVRAQMESGAIAEAFDIYAALRDSTGDATHQSALRGRFTSEERTALAAEGKLRKALIDA